MVVALAEVSNFGVDVAEPGNVDRVVLFGTGPNPLKVVIGSASGSEEDDDLSCGIIKIRMIMFMK